MKIIGCDVDGVLADFNEGYRRTLCTIGGRNGFENEPVASCWEPPQWYYAEHFGYTKDEDTRAWNEMLSSPVYWRLLNPYPGVCEFLHKLRQVNAEIYFITTRPGQTCKVQTECWLEAMGFYRPTVLIARGDKGGIARGLQLTHFLDDRPENCFDVHDTFPTCATFLFSRRYNVNYQEYARQREIRVVTQLQEFLTEVL